MIILLHQYITYSYIYIFIFHYIGDETGIVLRAETTYGAEYSVSILATISTFINLWESIFE